MKKLNPYTLGVYFENPDGEQLVLAMERPKSKTSIVAKIYAEAVPIPKLKETDIEFHHVERDLRELDRQKNMHYKVVIVGAGCAGLGAARQLIDEQGMDPSDILVLEGGDRIGGRIHTKLFEAKAGLPPVRVSIAVSTDAAADGIAAVAEAGAGKQVDFFATSAPQ